VGIEHYLAKNPAAPDYVVVARGGVVCGVREMKPNEIWSYKSHNLHYSCHTKHGKY